jgi:hypothetical protein
MFFRFVLIIFAITTGLCAHAQRKPFFDAYQAGLIVNHNNFSPAPRNWQQLAKNPYATPYQPDSMRKLGRRAWVILPNAQFGFQLGAQKNLGHWVRSKKANRLVWTTQLQLISGRFQSSRFSDIENRIFFGTVLDTSDFTGYTSFIEQQQSQLNLYNTLNIYFKSPLLKKIQYNIGLGLAAGMNFNGNFTEKTTTTRYRWNTQNRFFDVANTSSNQQVIAGKNMRHLSLVVPFGATWQVSPQLALALQHHYVLVKQNPDYTTPQAPFVNKSIEGYQLHFNIVYRPQIKK